jgi:hypothetical protein
MFGLYRVAFAALSCFALLTVTEATAEPVGKASAIRTTAYQQPPQATVGELHISDAVLRNAVLSTKPDSALEVTFLDGSKLSMGANSTMVVDEYVYGGPGGAGKQTLRYTQGLFRFVSGTIPKDQVKGKTPTVTIGIRGTIYRLKQNADGSGELAVEFGPNGEAYEVTLTDKDGKTVVLHSGEKIGWGAGGDFGDIGGGTIEGCE